MLRDRLARNLEQSVRRHVQCYCPADEVQEEFATEWQRLAQYLAEHGGLEEAVHRAYELLDPIQTKRHREVGLTKAAARLTSILRLSPGATDPQKPT